MLDHLDAFKLLLRLLKRQASQDAKPLNARCKESVLPHTKGQVNVQVMKARFNTLSLQTFSSHVSLKPSCYIALDSLPTTGSNKGKQLAYDNCRNPNSELKLFAEASARQAPTATSSAPRVKVNHISTYEMGVEFRGLAELQSEKDFRPLGHTATRASRHCRHTGPVYSAKLYTRPKPSRPATLATQIQSCCCYCLCCLCKAWYILALTMSPCFAAQSVVFRLVVL